MAAEHDEIKFEDKLYNYLHDFGGNGVKQWEKLDVHTPKELWYNFFDIVYELNQNKLSKKLSPTECNRLRHELLKQTKTPYDAGVFLYGVGGKSQITIQLDNGRSVCLTLFDQNDIGRGGTVYQVARQIQHPHTKPGRKNRRFDTTLLINGLPIIQIEEKADGVNNQNAFNQMKQYIEEGQYTGIFSTLQILVGMNPHDVRYMANTTYENFNTDFAFHWHCLKLTKDGKPGNVDRRNPVIQWKQFARHFLSIPMAHKMATNYMILDNSSNNKMLKVMRPYQVHATQNVLRKLRSYDFEMGNQKIGYVWHTTGSGKTISSFKTAYLASRLCDGAHRVDKVVYLVDRLALTNQTTDAYEAYDPTTDKNNNHGIVTGTTNIFDLKRKLKNKYSKIIVTTTQKLYDLVDKLHFKLPKVHVVFIVDEAHHGAGQGLLEIKKAFRESAWIGYTGTPKFHSDARGTLTTPQVFGPALHIYTISAAIADQNVLGFRVNMESTLSRKFVLEYFHHKDPKLSQSQIIDKIHHLTKLDIDDQLSSTIYDNNKYYVPLVVKNVLDKWEQRSHNYKYNALFTTRVGGRQGSSRMLEMYYDEFKRQNAKRARPLKIAVTFSQDTSDGNNQIKNNNLLRKVITGYNKEFNTSFTDNSKDIHAYMDDLTTRFTHSIDGGKHMGLDLVIVVDQLLTGFDAPRMNTLYVDRSLRGAKLIQAYSRTNRIYDMQDKPRGIIVNYRWPAYSKYQMNKALAVYGDPKSATTDVNLKIPANVIGESYQDLVKDLRKNVEILARLTNNFTQVSPDESEQQQTYKEIKLHNNLLGQAKQCDEYDPKKLLKDIDLNGDQLEQLNGYITETLKERISHRQNIDIDDVNLRMEPARMVDLEDVNYRYISRLLAKLMNAHHGYVTPSNHGLKQKDIGKNIKELKMSLYVALEHLEEQHDAKYANQVRRLMHLVLIGALDKTLSGSSYPIKENDVNTLLHKTNNNSKDQLINSCVKKYGIQHISNINNKIDSLIKHHVYGHRDLGRGNILENILIEGTKAYKNVTTNKQILALSKIDYYDELRTALYKLADKIVKDY